MSWVAVAIGGSAVVGAYTANRASRDQRRVADQQGQLIGLQRDAANQLMPWGRGLMDRGTTAMTSLLPYYTRAAFGDRNQLSHLMAPELQQIRQNYDRPLMQLTELSPRTGTTAAATSSILSGRAEAMNDALLRTRFAGMQGLQGIGGQLADTGSRAVGAAFGGLSGASGANLGLLSQLFGIRNQNNADSEAIGSSIVDVMRAYNQWNAGRTPAAGVGTTPSGSGGTGPTGTPGNYPGSPGYGVY